MNVLERAQFVFGKYTPIRINQSSLFNGKTVVYYTVFTLCRRFDCTIADTAGCTTGLVNYANEESSQAALK